MPSAPTHCVPPQILLYVPNLVGYARVGLLAAALRVGTSDPVTCCYLCLANILLDGVDGALARALNQASLSATKERCLSSPASEAVVILIKTFPHAVMLAHWELSNW